MKISSQTTYLLPIILLLIPCYYISFISFEDVAFSFVSSFANMYLLFPALLSIILFYFFKLLVRSRFLQYLKYTLLFIPLVLTKFLIYFTESHYDLGTIFAIIIGGILYLSFIEFLYRYTAVLNDESLIFKNILGISKVVKLTDIIKLEQKINLLGVFKELNFLNLSKKTIVVYQEKYDEYQIKFFASIGEGDRIFSKIISNANKIGNQKIKMYGY